MEALGSITRNAAVAVLDACWLQQKLLTSNIANHASANFQPTAVDFVDFLERLEASVSEQRASGRAAMTETIEPQIRLQQEDVQLDVQVRDLSINAARYEATLTLLNRLQSMNHFY